MGYNGRGDCNHSQTHIEVVDSAGESSWWHLKLQSVKDSDTKGRRQQNGELQGGRKWVVVKIVVMSWTVSTDESSPQGLLKSWWEGRTSKED